MSFVWSKNAPHLQWLDCAWRADEGVSEDELQEAETRLGLRLPPVLRGFYRYWGDRHQVHESLEGLATPDALFVRSGILIFVFENQGVFCRGIKLQDLRVADPPVYLAYNDEPAPTAEELEWHRTHDHVSDYLDALVMLHAGRYGVYSPHQDHRQLEHPLVWHRVDIQSVPLYFTADSPHTEWTVFVREDGEYIDPWAYSNVDLIQPI